MKKKILAAAIIISMLSLCACGKKAEESKEKPENITAAETEAVKETVANAAEPETEADAVETAEEVTASELIRLTCTTIDEGRAVADNYSGDAYVKYPQFNLSEADAEAYPELQAAFEKLNKNYEENYNEHLEYSFGVKKEAAAEGTDVDEAFYSCLMSRVQRADSHIVSIQEYYDSYDGGVHGYYSYYGDNIDPNTGKELQLVDVVKDMDGFMATVKEKLYANYPEVEFTDLDGALKDMAAGEDGTALWTMDYTGVTVYFNPYHITDYASGMQIITVPFNENQDLFISDYLDVPDTYVQQLGDGNPVYIDINGDGINEAVFVTSRDTEEPAEGEEYISGYQTWIVCNGNDILEIEDWSYRGDVYLVRSNGNYYVHIFDTGDNDYATFLSVDLNDMKYVPEDSMNASLATLDSQYDYWDGGFKSVLTEDVYTDPSDVTLASRLDVMGTNFGIRDYSIGQDGWLKPVDENYHLSTTMVYTARKDADCILVDAGGNEAGSAKISTGKCYRLVRTDGSTYADLQEVDAGDVITIDEYPYTYTEEAEGLNESEPIYRLNVNINDWPHTIEGFGEEDLFDGILYAG